MLKVYWSISGNNGEPNASHHFASFRKPNANPVLSYRKLVTLQIYLKRGNLSKILLGRIIELIISKYNVVHAVKIYLGKT